MIPDAYWNTDTLRANLISCCLTNHEGCNNSFKKQLYSYLRWALLEGSPGPGIPESMDILGKTETVLRTTAH